MAGGSRTASGVVCSRLRNERVDPSKATIPQVAEFFLYLCQELGLSVLPVKDYWVALNHVFSLMAMDLASSSVILRMFHSFERSCPPLEVRPLDWNLPLILQCLSWLLLSPRSWPLTDTLPGRCPFYLLLCQPEGLVSYTVFPFVFVTRAVGDSAPSLFFLTLWPRPRILLFLTLGLISSYEVPSPDNFVDGDQDELFLCPIRALRKYHSWTEQYRPGIESLFISTGMWKKWVSCSIISFWLLSVISLLIRPLQRRIVILCGSGLTKSGRLRRLCCVRGTARSIRY